MKDLIGIKHVSKNLKYMNFIEYCRTNSMKECVKILHMHSKFQKNSIGKKTATGAQRFYLQNKLSDSPILFRVQLLAIKKRNLK